MPDSALVKKGTLTMSVNPTLPPMQFVDQTGALKGMRVELGEAIAKRLCLTPEYVRIEFSAMIPGLQAGRWDVINTGIFYTDERAKLMQMLPYEDQAISISTAKGNPLKITKPEDLSGKSIGVEIGGFEERKARELDKQLTDKGMKGMTIRTFENFAMAFQALRAGQVEVALSIDSTGRRIPEARRLRPRAVRPVPDAGRAGRQEQGAVGRDGQGAQRHEGRRQLPEAVRPVRREGRSTAPWSSRARRADRSRAHIIESAREVHGTRLELVGVRRLSVQSVHPRAAR